MVRRYSRCDIPEPNEQPGLDLFEAGLDSLRCFELIDDLAAVGVDVDFSALASDATAGYLLAQLDHVRPAA